MASNSTRRNKQAKPRPDFPLFPHATGYWAKKVRGKLHYFGRVVGDPKGDAALEVWLEQKDYLLAGRTPRIHADGLTIRDLCNHFLTTKEQQRDAGDIKPRTFDDYYSTCQFVVDSFGKTRLVADLAADDFRSLRSTLAKRYGVHRLCNEVQRTRTIFKYGFEAGLLDSAVRFGPTFKRPSNRIIRAHRQQNGPRMFDAQQLRTIIKTADQPLKAMILLGVNCGFGNHDCGTLPKRALDLKAGWVDFPRPKTAVERRCPLWPETVEAIKEAMLRRPKAKHRQDDQLVFITKYGQPWTKESSSNPITQEFRKILDDLKLYRRGLGFYALRHTFETIAGGSLDQIAVNHIMGHVDNSMAGVYREKIEDKRLLAVSAHVRELLFPRRKPK